MDYLQITPYIRSLAELSERNNGIKPEMYLEHDVKRGLRNLNGNGVVTGLTEISCIKSKEIGPNGGAIPCEGELRYRGIDIREIVGGFVSERRAGFEKTVYLLLFSKLPNAQELADFREQLATYRTLPPSFVRT